LNVSAVVVVACPSATVNVSGVEATPAYVESPPYTALTAYVPGATPAVDTLNAASPLDRFAVPSCRHYIPAALACLPPPFPYHDSQ